MHEKRTIMSEAERTKRRSFGTRFFALFLSILLVFSAVGCEPKPAPDTAPPVFSGLHDLETVAGMSPAYREGVTATDETDGELPYNIDLSAVDLETPGTYRVVYSVRDAAGNETIADVTLTVTPRETVPLDEDGDGEEGEPPIEEPIPEDLSEEMVYELADAVLAKITTPDMDLSEKAYAIYSWTIGNIRYVGTSDKTNWLIGAYVGFVRMRGDCYNYYAVAKALLSRVGIPTIDLVRIPSKTRHYWLLANIGTGWFHFDAGPQPTGYPFNAFFATEEEVRAYSKLLEEEGIRENYYVYDYEACPVTVEGTPEDAGENAPGGEGDGNPSGGAGENAPGTGDETGENAPVTGGDAGENAPGTDLETEGEPSGGETNPVPGADEETATPGTDDETGAVTEGETNLPTGDGDATEPNGPGGEGSETTPVTGEEADENQPSGETNADEGGESAV